MTLDLNIPPYYADYDKNGNYYGYIFRPRAAVQSRELTGLQQMLQTQIERFGKHIFQEGSIVLGGGFDLEIGIDYVKGINIPTSITDINGFVNKTIVGSVSGVSAYVRAVEYDSDNNWYVFFIRYTAGSATSDTFLVNESVQVEGDPTHTFTTTPTDCIGQGSIFSISEGVIFKDGYFVLFPYQTVVLEKYSVTPSVTVGFKTVHSIINEYEDPSLFDNALGYSNENAPGAHRLAIDATLTRLDYGAGQDDPEFTALLEVKNGVVEAREERSQYSRIYEELAKRTFDESGDYIVRGLNVITREHLDTGSNEGLYTLAQGGNTNLISLEVDPGTAYVKGYEKNILTTQHVITEKSTTFNYVNESFVNATQGGYFVIKEAVGHPILDVGTLVNLYDAAETRITSGVPSTTAPGGSIIGTARVKSIVYDTGTLGTAAATLRLYLYDINVTTGVLSDARGVGISGSFFADIVLTDGKALFQESNLNVLLFPLGSDYTKSLRGELGQCETSFIFHRTDDSKSIEFSPNTGTYSVSVAITGEEIPYDGALSSAQKRELVLSVKAAKDFELPGVVSNTNASTIDGTATNFTRLNIGDRIKANGVLYFVNSIANATSMTVVGTLSTALSGDLIYRSFLAGDIVDLTANGSSGSTRTATATAGTLTIDLMEDVSANATLADGTLAARLSYPVRRSGSVATEISKELRDNRYVKIDCTGYTANQLAQPISLGIPDVYQIREIRKHTSTFSTGSEGSDVTDQFTLDNGQRDNLYDHARIWGPVANTDYLLVKFDHFEASFASGLGYFSVDSYPINDEVDSNTTIFTYEIPTYSATNGSEYNLRNVLDFRPYKANTANSSTTVGGATTNPGTTTTLESDADGLRIPMPDSTIGLDYSYYLARRDIITMDIDGNFNVIKGAPAAAPVSPSVPENVMALAKIYIPPYPSITEINARILGLSDGTCNSVKIASQRLTQRELNVMKERIDTLDYYNALNLLEKNAADLKIIDPTTGLDRFKNGFFVDGFLDHSLGATYNPDYSIAVDRIEQVIRPKFHMDSFRYKYEATGSSGVQQTGPVITLPYTEEVLLTQNNVSTTRNIEQSVYRFIGTIEATPNGDIWTDTKTVSKTFQFGNDLPPTEVMGTEWGSWSTYHTGYNVYNRKVNDRSGDPTGRVLGTFSSYSQALAAGKKIDPNKDGRYLIESVNYQERTGVQTSVGYEFQTQTIGNFVTDTTLATYIRPQIIQLYARGLKARTRYYVFFDGEDMNDYVTPMVIPDTGIEDADTYLAEGAEWRTDDYGELLGFLRLPATGKRFRVGTKEIIITDNPTNSIDATSYAKYYWTALGLNVQKQKTILSTVVPVVIEDEVRQTRKKQTTSVIGPSCMAYTFKVDVPETEEGIFLTSVDVFIAEMHPTLGVWFEIREMNSGGGITRTQVPYSEVWMRRDDPRINISDDPNALVATKVDFPAPVFLYNDTQYAFVIHTEGLNPDTYFWISRLGETDLRTGEQITSRRLTGTLFTTNNNLNYDMVPDVDLLITFNRAKFTPDTSGVAVLGNNPTEFVNLSSLSGNFLRQGEVLTGSEILTLANIVGANSIIVGDKITGANSALQANIIAISGSSYYTDGWDFVLNEGFTIQDVANTSKSITGNVATITSGSGTLRSYDTNDNYLIIDDSNGSFFSNVAIRGEFSGDEARITTFTNYPYSTVELKPHFLTFNRTSIDFEKRGWATGLSTFGDYYPGIPDDTSSFNEECAILSRTTEIASFSGLSSAQIKMTLTTQTEYLSPIIDLSRANAIYVHNLINNDDTDEAGNASGGNALNKYISKTVTLADGQDAEDIVVRLTAYRPPNSTVKVYYKIRNDEDGDLFEEKNWVEMDYNDVYSSLANRFNFVDFEFTVPAAQLTGGIVTYQSDGNTFLGFKQFAIKIVLLGTNSAIVPRVADLQVIALQS